MRIQRLAVFLVDFFNMLLNLQVNKESILNYLNTAKQLRIMNVLTSIMQDDAMKPLVQCLTISLALL